MNIWHYAIGQTSRGPVSDMELHHLARTGQLPSDALVWREGMSEWKPLDEVFPHLAEPETARCAVSGEERPVEELLMFGDQYVLPENKEIFLQQLREGGDNLKAVPRHDGYRYEDPRRRAVPVMGLFIAGTALELAITGLGFLASRSSPEDPVVMIVGALSLVLAAVYLSGAVFFLRWKHLVCRNAHVFNRGLMRFTPGWAVGSYFIPILNLWRPCQAMREIWEASQADRHGSSSVIGGWWALWITSGIAGQVSFRTQLRGMEEAAQIADSVSAVLAIPLLLCILKIIRTINNAQAALAEQG